MGSTDGQQKPRAGVHIGSVTGSAFAIGDHNTVTQNGFAADGDDPQAELLRVVGELRADLARFVATDATGALDSELAAVEEEIGTEGAAAPGRLVRLREAMEAAGAFVATLASGVAVGHELSALLGG
ncbi:hypothetical protein [Streptomyces sp. NBC_00102]|uniref:hypothetical protein n=1 Tax=Streptomyces sp. NBC_00102 TaxID=2975652 RepID=UPI00224C9187|nr:hypothetical protein [Streptomyces sp. NBC_00102]MCX5399238.1 hypothetical protein [Streptomyces sp. NBC_00102]